MEQQYHHPGTRAFVARVDNVAQLAAAVASMEAHNASPMVDLDGRRLRGRNLHLHAAFVYFHDRVWLEVPSRGGELDTVSWLFENMDRFQALWCFLCGKPDGWMGREVVAHCRTYADLVPTFVALRDAVVPLMSSLSLDDGADRPIG